MKLLLDDAGHAVLEDGKPVYEAGDGKRIAFDAPQTVATITRLNAEAKAHREGKEAAESRLKAFSGIEDADAARKAMEMIRNIDAKKLIDAGEVERVRADMAKTYEQQVKAAKDEAESFRRDLYNEKIGGAFSRSKFIAEKTAVPADLLQAAFGANFKVEGGAIIATDRQGNQIYSRQKPGELADFDEALSLLVESYPHRDQVLRAPNNGGGGARAGGARGGEKTISRAAFQALAPAAQANAVTKEGLTVVD